MSNQMEIENNRSLYRSITRRYLLAVLIIAFLSSGAFYTLKSALSDSDSTAYVVNVSGRQRMLSQHIALDAHRLFHEKYIKQIEYEKTAQLMNQLITDMEQANRQLSSGVLAEENIVDLSATIRDMYFGEMDLTDRVSEYLEIAREVVNSSDLQTAYEFIQQIDLVSEDLLRDLNRVVNQYQKEGEERLLVIERLELFVLITTLIALLLEVFFIFRPMAKEVIAAKRSEQHVLENLQDMVELRTIKLADANKKLKKLATHDPLTSLRNRLTLEVDIEKLLYAFHRHKSPFSICMIDIDYFKQINDNYGHPAGDYVLKEFAQLMRDMVRGGDRIYRAGGEEFVIILSRISMDEAMSRMGEFRMDIERRQFCFHEYIIEFTISIGIIHSDGIVVQDVHEILQAVDKALYMSKEQGRNRITVADV